MRFCINHTNNRGGSKMILWTHTKFDLHTNGPTSYTLSYYNGCPVEVRQTFRHDIIFRRTKCQNANIHFYPKANLFFPDMGYLCSGLLKVMNSLPKIHKNGSSCACWSILEYNENEVLHNALRCRGMHMVSLRFGCFNLTNYMLVLRTSHVKMSFSLREIFPCSWVCASAVSVSWIIKHLAYCDRLLRTI